MTPQSDEAHRLMRLARRDQDTFLLLLPIEQAALSALGFHAQQAAEKALKAVTVLAGLELMRTHDLVALGAQLTGRGVSPPLTLDELRVLNPFAVEFRYDDELVPLISRDELALTLSRLLTWAQAYVDANAQ